MKLDGHVHWPPLQTGALGGQPVAHPPIVVDVVVGTAVSAATLFTNVSHAPPITAASPVTTQPPFDSTFRIASLNFASALLTHAGSTAVR